MGRWYYLPEDKDTPANWLASVTNILEVAQHKHLATYLKNTPKKVRTSKLEESASLGTKIHDLVEHDLDNVTIPPEELSYKLGEQVIDLTDFLQRWRKLKEENQIKATVMELPVVSKVMGFAGTMDLMGTYAGHPTIFDIKSGRYSVKAGWQMAAYRYACTEMLHGKGDAHVAPGFGMVGLSLAWNRPVQTLQYSHLDYCWSAFLSTFNAWKAMYANELNKMGWRYKGLHAVPEVAWGN